jgi:hypothetical protein
MHKRGDLAGKRFGRWTVISYSGQDHANMVLYLCRCICGKEKQLRGGNLSNGHSRGCRDCLRIRPFEALYNIFQKKARKRDKEIELTYEEFLEFTDIPECHYCGVPVFWTTHHTVKFGRKYNLDRKDNSVGYVKSNLLVCCYRCNRIKSDDIPYDEMLQIGQAIKSWRLRCPSQDDEQSRVPPPLAE